VESLLQNNAEKKLLHLHNCPIRVPITLNGNKTQTVSLYAYFVTLMSIKMLSNTFEYGKKENISIKVLPRTY